MSENYERLYYERTRMYDELIEECGIAKDKLVDCAKELALKDKVIEELKRAVEFYADKENWIIRNKAGWVPGNPRHVGDEEQILNYEHPGTDWVGTVRVGGKLARATLSEVKLMREGK